MLSLRPPRGADFHAAVLSVPLLALPGVLAAQSVITVSLEQCVWRTGDDPAWAAAGLDESGWRPSTQWKMPVLTLTRLRAGEQAAAGLAGPAFSTV